MTVAACIIVFVIVTLCYHYVYAMHAMNYRFTTCLLQYIWKSTLISFGCYAL